MTEPTATRHRLLGTAILTLAALLLSVGVAGLVWSGFIGTILLLRRTLGPHAFTAIAVLGLSTFSGAAAIAGAFLFVLGRSLRRTPAAN